MQKKGKKVPSVAYRRTRVSPHESDVWADYKIEAILQILTEITVDLRLRTELSFCWDAEQGKEEPKKLRHPHQKVPKMLDRPQLLQKYQN